MLIAKKRGQMSGSQDLIAGIIGDIYASNEWDKHLRILCDEIGTKSSGSEGEKQARDFILNRCKKYRLEHVYPEKFEYPSWQRIEESLNIIEPVKKEIKTLSLGGVPSTAPRGVTGEIVLVGDGRPRDFEYYKNRITGKIVLAYERSTFGEEDRVAKIQRACQLGARGFLLVNHSYGGIQLAGNGGFGKAIEIPAASISREDGEYLERLLAERSRVKVNLYLKNRIENRTSWNVIGEITGQERANEHVIVGTHYDSCDICPGAVDDTSGVVVALELARTFANHKNIFRRTIRFVFFSAEENGIWGSRAYVTRHIEDLKDIVLMLNVDPGGKVDNCLVEGFSDLIFHMETLAKKNRFSMEIKRYPDYHNDSFPFMFKGVPAIWLPGNPCKGNAAGFIHSPVDTIDKISIRRLKEGAMTVAHILLDIVNIDKRPEDYKSQDEVKKWLEMEPSLVETLKIVGFWPFAHKV